MKENLEVQVDHKQDDDSLKNKELERLRKQISRKRDAIAGLKTDNEEMMKQL